MTNGGDLKPPARIELATTSLLVCWLPYYESSSRWNEEVFTFATGALPAELRRLSSTTDPLCIKVQSSLRRGYLVFD